MDPGFRITGGDRLGGSRGELDAVVDRPGRAVVQRLVKSLVATKIGIKIEALVDNRFLSRTP